MKDFTITISLFWQGFCVGNMFLIAAVSVFYYLANKDTKKEE